MSEDTFTCKTCGKSFEKSNGCALFPNCGCTRSGYEKGWSTVNVSCEEFDELADKVDTFERELSGKQNQINILRKQVQVIEISMASLQPIESRLPGPRPKPKPRSK